MWYQQQLKNRSTPKISCCDLLKNIYLCGINNNLIREYIIPMRVVICLKISTFVVSTTTNYNSKFSLLCCDLLKNIYLCGINNNESAKTDADRGCDLLKNIYLCGINNNSLFVICCLSKGYKVVEENKNGTTKRNPTSLKWDFCFLLR